MFSRASDRRHRLLAGNAGASAARAGGALRPRTIPVLQFLRVGDLPIQVRRELLQMPDAFSVMLHGKRLPGRNSATGLEYTQAQAPLLPDEARSVGTHFVRQIV